MCQFYLHKYNDDPNCSNGFELGGFLIKNNVSKLTCDNLIDILGHMLHFPEVSELTLGVFKSDQCLGKTITLFSFHKKK